jgi:antibiotic biosynthesis monooxygenase (ABM) superfamily enzyme
MNPVDFIPDPPVTIDVIKQVKPGCESEFESALTELITAAEGFDGHLGATVRFQPKCVLMVVANSGTSTTVVGKVGF